MKKYILAMPGLLLCAQIWLLPIENKHYGFDKPGVSTDSITIIVFLSILAIGYALTVLFLRHRNKHDFLFQYITLFLAFYKMIQIVFLVLSYC